MNTFFRSLLRISTYTEEPCQFLRYSFTNKRGRVKKVIEAENKSTKTENMGRRILCVAEKNDAAKNIANLLSNGQARFQETRSKYNKLYVFDCSFRGQNATFAFTSVSGHIMNMEFEPACQNWDQYPIKQLFNAKIIRSVIPQMKDIELSLKVESRKAEVLIIWTDCDREGENIGAEVVEICCKENPRLQVYRAKFSEITRQAVSRAMNNLGAIDMNMSNAVNCRQELDLRTGAIFTRLLTMSIKRSGLCAHIFKDQKVVSYGSCQFPTLGFVVERYSDIQSFVPEDFWKLVGNDQDSTTKVDFVWARGRVFDEQCIKAFKEMCDCDIENVRVVDISNKPKPKWRPQPMNTVELEKLSIRNLKINSKKALAAAEKLYIKGFISYPRTETTIFPKDINIGDILNSLQQNRIWQNFIIQEIIGKGGPVPRNGNKTDNAHPPIHPVKNATENDLGGMETDEWKIYELIVRHFLACISRDAKAHETKVKVQVGERGEVFTATGLKIEDRGYLMIYPYDIWSNKAMPNYTLHQKLKHFVVNICACRTQPKKLLNEADLIALMDKYGIGTDATHSEHVDKIKQRGYVTLTIDNRYHPTPLGISLVESYKQIGVKYHSGYEMEKPNLRADFEKDLLKICNGEKQPNDVLKQHLSLYQGIYNCKHVLAVRFANIIKVIPERKVKGNVMAAIFQSMYLPPEAKLNPDELDDLISASQVQPQEVEDDKIISEEKATQ